MIFLGIKEQKQFPETRESNLCVILEKGENVTFRRIDISC